MTEKQAGERIDELLTEIEEGRGAFSRDPHVFAENTIDNAKRCAREIRQLLAAPRDAPTPQVDSHPVTRKCAEWARALADHIEANAEDWSRTEDWMSYVRGLRFVSEHHDLRHPRIPTKVLRL